MLKYFKRDKCPGLDAWTVELFTHFFDILQGDLLAMVEESRIKVYIHPYICLTYIALIPKRTSTGSFMDYRPISFCNLIYQIISETIAGKIKHTLSKYIWFEQFSFLQNRQIHNVVATTQECFYSIHTKKLNAIVMKVNLQKAYDCLYWGYFRMVLQKIGI